YRIPFSFYKREGLFDSPEAIQILSLLEAIAQPWATRRAAKACLTEFFSFSPIEIRDFLEKDNSLPIEPLLGHLNHLASEGRYGTMFDRLLEKTGYMERRLSAKEGQQLLITTQIFQILRDVGETDALTLEQLIEQLKGYISGILFDEGSTLNLQPSETTRDQRPGVQLLTMHKSKGLEAKVVFLIGGLSKGRTSGKFTSWHSIPDNGMVVGVLPQDPRIISRHDQEKAGEVERLYYVALTRASEKLVLPLFTDREGLPLALIKGRYAVLNRHLALLMQESVMGELATVINDLDQFTPLAPSAPDIDRAVPPTGIWDPEEIERHRGPRLYSYSSLTRGAAPDHIPLLSFEHHDLGEREESSGAVFGSFVHELMEHAHLPEMMDTSFEDWRQSPRTTALLKSASLGYELLAGEEENGLVLCHRGLTAPCSISGLSLPLGLCQLKDYKREMEFLFPVSECRVDQGKVLRVATQTQDPENFMRGFMDVVFSHHGTLWILDWKTDILPKYCPDTISEHAQNHYAVQALIYAAAISRLAGLINEETYEKHFGGILYSFLRGYTAHTDSLTLIRPGFSDLAPLLG
ncbi:PD-(D/E)XK nuclease family protein, partial [Myxococcota bacterium]|nr:PD-(D/E)XK nuclease family protein [Myxococcota bacterium]